MATGNLGKLLDFATAASAVSGGWRLEPLPGLEAMVAPEETGVTFAANAEAKALYYSTQAATQLPNCWVMADDSGLEVDALDGAPGVYSARYAERLGLTPPPGGARLVSAEGLNNASLLMQLAASGSRVRTARYRCALAVACSNEIIAASQGSVEGEILSEPRGAGGFGYDPLFYLPQLRRTMAELGRVERLSVNHRGEALRRLLGAWRG